jgi:YHS domain-containing protein
MQVDQHQAEKVGLLVTLDGTTYQFCSRDCMLDFLKDHKKYATRSTPPGRPANQSAMPEMDHHQPGKGASPSMPSDSMPPDVQTIVPGGTPWAPIPPSESPRTEAGGAPAPGQEWSVGWGKFPGAEYLGLKERKRQAPGEPMPAMPASAEEEPKPAEAAAGHHPAMMASPPPAEDDPATEAASPPSQHPVDKASTPGNAPSPGGMGGHHH